MAKKKRRKKDLPFDSRAKEKTDVPFRDCYYILHIYRNHRNSLRLHVVKKHFLFEDQAKYSIERNIENRKRLNFEVISGEDMIYYGFKFRSSSLTDLFTKHDYPEELKDCPKKKRAFRLQSQRMRRKGIILKAEDYHYVPDPKKRNKKARYYTQVQGSSDDTGREEQKD